MTSPLLAQLPDVAGQGSAAIQANSQQSASSQQPAISADLQNQVQAGQVQAGNTGQVQVGNANTVQASSSDRVQAGNTNAQLGTEATVNGQNISGSTGAALNNNSAAANAGISGSLQPGQIAPSVSVQSANGASVGQPPRTSYYGAYGTEIQSAAQMQSSGGTWVTPGTYGTASVTSGQSYYYPTTTSNVVYASGNYPMGTAGSTWTNTSYHSDSSCCCPTKRGLRRAWRR